VPSALAAFVKEDALERRRGLFIEYADTRCKMGQGRRDKNEIA
jgi:hypothetical protein